MSFSPQPWVYGHWVIPIPISRPSPTRAQVPSQAAEPVLRAAVRLAPGVATPPPPPGTAVRRGGASPLSQGSAARRLAAGLFALPPSPFPPRSLSLSSPTVPSTSFSPP